MGTSARSASISSRTTTRALARRTSLAGAYAFSARSSRKAAATTCATRTGSRSTSRTTRPERSRHALTEIAGADNRTCAGAGTSGSAFAVERTDLARAACTRAGLTQQGMADLIRVHRVTVARWESGEQAPDAPARALLTVIEALPREAVAALRS
ncbi:MAG: helix-turn-helix domain-containing protein [Planctomycetota bacterium]|nr:helix-turn-helix domain-containing protein [Planctomycetota bacterium]